MITKRLKMQLFPKLQHSVSVLATFQLAKEELIEADQLKNLKTHNKQKLRSVTQPENWKKRTGNPKQLKDREEI